jgi:hypothetical protein
MSIIGKLKLRLGNFETQKAQGGNVDVLLILNSNNNNNSV